MKGTEGGTEEVQEMCRMYRLLLGAGKEEVKERCRVGVEEVQGGL